MTFEEEQTEKAMIEEQLKIYEARLEAEKDEDKRINKEEAEIERERQLQELTTAWEKMAYIKQHGGTMEKIEHEIKILTKKYPNVEMTMQKKMK